MAHAQASTNELNLADPVARRRFAVKPGLISPWWIRQRANIAYGREIDCDAAYVNARSLMGDVAILLRAIVATCYGRSRPTADRITLFGIAIDNFSMDRAIAEIIAATEQDGPPRQVSFVNADCVNLAHRDPRYREALADSTRVFADGIGMKIAGRVLGSEIRENLCGTDVFPRLCAAPPNTTSRSTCWALGRAWPRRLASGSAAIIRPRESPAGRTDITTRPMSRRSSPESPNRGPTCCSWRLEPPKQELWIREHLAATGAKIALGVGGLFDYYSGRIPARRYGSAKSAWNGSGG